MTNPDCARCQGVVKFGSKFWFHNGYQRKRFCSGRCMVLSWIHVVSSGGMRVDNSPFSVSFWYETS